MKYAPPSIGGGKLRPIKAVETCPGEIFGSKTTVRIEIREIRGEKFQSVSRDGS